MQHSVLDERWRRISISLAVVGLVGFTPYITVPLLLNGYYCPETTFTKGMMSSVFTLSCSFISSVVCYICLSAGILPKKEGNDRFKFQFLDNFVDDHCWMFLLTTISGIVVGGFFWINSASSYYCLMPSGILSHQSVLMRPQMMDWAEVTTVEARCGSTRRGSYGGLTAFLSSHQEIWIPLGRGEALAIVTLENIHTALEGHRFNVVADASVSEGQCPPKVLQLFSRPL